MHLLDRALERGLLGDGDYMLRANALQQATDIEQMNEIVQQLPVLEVPAKVRTTRSPPKARMPVNIPDDLADKTAEPPFDPDDLSALDAVDVAMLMRSVQVRKAPSTNRRVAALGIVAVLFLLLVILGLYLASHDHAVNSNGIALMHQSAVSAFPMRIPVRF